MLPLKGYNFDAIFSSFILPKIKRFTWEYLSHTVYVCLGVISELGHGFADLMVPFYQ